MFSTLKTEGFRDANFFVNGGRLSSHANLFVIDGTECSHNDKPWWYQWPWMTTLGFSNMFFLLSTNIPIQALEAVPICTRFATLLPIPRSPFCELCHRAKIPFNKESISVGFLRTVDTRTSHMCWIGKDCLIFESCEMPIYKQCWRSIYLTEKVYGCGQSW